MDKISKAVRSRIMASVRNKHTRPEVLVRYKLHNAGFRYSLHSRHLPGEPDIVLSRFRIAVFVHGCFWHGHDCRRGKRPQTRTEFWDAKLDRNLARDQSATEQLAAMGWRVEVIWECSWEAQVDELISILKQLRLARSP